MPKSLKSRLPGALLQAGAVLGCVLLALSLVRVMRPSSPLLRAIGDFPALSVARSSECSLGSVWRLQRAADADTAAANQYSDKVKVLRSDGAFTEIQLAADRFWIPARDLRRTSFVFLEEEHGIYEFGEHRVRPGDTVLDCGANVGAFARRCLKAGAGKVICVDPSPESVECLRRNFSAEIKDGRVIVCPVGVWNEETRSNSS